MTAKNSRSAWVTPSTSPKSMLEKSRKLRDLEMISTPRANMDVNRTPMAVSSRSSSRPDSHPMPRAVSSPATSAPKNTLMPCR